MRILQNSSLLAISIAWRFSGLLRRLSMFIRVSSNCFLNTLKSSIVLRSSTINPVKYFRCNMKWTAFDKIVDFPTPMLPQSCTMLPLLFLSCLVLIVVTASCTIFSLYFKSYFACTSFTKIFSDRQIGSPAVGNYIEVRSGFYVGTFSLKSSTSSDSNMIFEWLTAEWYALLIFSPKSIC